MPALRGRRAALALLVATVCVVAVVRGAADAQDSDELPRKAGHLGIRIAAVPDDIARRSNLKPDEGVFVEVVAPESAAARAGLKPADILLEIDGRAIEGVPAFLQAIPRMKAGHRFALAVLRAGKRITAPVTLGTRPPDRGANFDVLYRHVKSKGARIRTIVSRPHAPGPHPALVLLQGAAAASIDEPLASTSAYSRILNAFAEAGWVTVRIEKPGIGDSEGGPYAETDFTTELDAYRQALLAVTTTGFVDRENVFLFGHSMGGVFAPLLAAEIPVRGVAVYGTVVKRWIDYALENTRRQSLLAGNKPETTENAVRALDVLMQDFFVQGRSYDDVMRERAPQRPALQRFFPDRRYDGRAFRFWSQLQRTDLAAAWTKGAAHVLALWGKHDFIASEDDHPRIVALVEKARPGKGTYLALDGIDHGFRQTASMEDSFRRWNTPRGEVNLAVVTALKTWTDKVRHVP
jgi:alpha-beta hydrolase superfamily lysophospholipase